MKKGEMIPLLSEHSLAIRLNGRLFIHLICTRTRLKELVYGRLVSEGMI